STAPGRSYGCTRGRSYGQGKPTGSPQLCGSSSGCARRSASRVSPPRPEYTIADGHGSDPCPQDLPDPELAPHSGRDGSENVRGWSLVSARWTCAFLTGWIYFAFDIAGHAQRRISKQQAAPPFGLDRRPLLSQKGAGCAEAMRRAGQDT